MAITFNKKSWQSRVSEHPTRRRLTIVDQSLSYSLVDVSREEGTVEAVGDTFDKSTMDDLENRIENIAITAQAECDGLQEQIDNLPSLDEAKAVDIGHKETCSTNTPLGGSVRVNPFEIYNGTLAYKTNASQAGSTYQAVGTGKNLLPYPYTNSTTTFNDVYYTDIGDGTIKCNGTASGGTSYFNFQRYKSGVNIDTEGTYTLSRTILSGSGTFTIQATVRDSNGDVKSRERVDNNTASKTFTLATGDYVADCFLYIEDGNSANNLVIAPQIETGSSATSYEPYTGRQPAPTPTNPSAIVGIGTEQADHTWSVTVGGVTASGLAYPLYEGDILDFATGTVYRVNGRVDMGSLNYTMYSVPNGNAFVVTLTNGKQISNSYNTGIKCTAYKEDTTVNNAYYISDVSCKYGGSYFGTTKFTAVDSNYTDATSFKTAMNGQHIVYPLATPTIERVTITGADAVIRGFIPSARFFQMGRRYIEESVVMNPNESLNDYFKGYTLQSESTTLWYSQEDVDDKANVIWTQYGYDAEHQTFLDSVAGEIYTPTGAISCDFTVSDIWAYGADAVSEKCVSGVPAHITNRLATNSNGFPIELKPVNQSDVSSLVVGSPVQFRITGDLYINVERGGLLCREQGSSTDSQFYEYDMGTDSRQGVFYHQHYFDVPRGTSIQLSDYTFASGFTFNLCQYRDSSTWLNELSWTVTDSDVVITANNDTTANGIVLSIRHRKNGDTEGEFDTFENIVINVT